MKRSLLLCMLWVSALSAKAQNYEKRPWMPLENRLGLALGIGQITYLDKNSSPLIYQSRPKNVRLFYNLETNHFLFSVDLDVRMGSNAPKYQRNRTLFFQEQNYKGGQEDKKFPAGGSMLAGRVSLGAYYKIKSTQESTFKVAVGGRVMNEMFYPQGWNSGGLFNALSFSPEGWAQHKIDQHHSFTANIRIPVAARLTRLAYDNTVSAPGKNQMAGFFRNTSGVGLKKFITPAASINYNYQLNSKWGAGLTYEWGWYLVTTPQTMRAVSQSVLANFYHQL